MQVAVATLLINHLIGAIGLNTSEYATSFSELSWLNLIISFVFVLAFHQNFTPNFLGSLCFAFSFGMAVEIVGVTTGLPFGEYYYTDKFGWKLWGVPVLIGLNWTLLSYCSAHFAAKFLKQRWQQIVTAALSMMLLDVLLEPFAIRHGFWVWAGETPPIQNYISWFLVSLPIQWFMTRRSEHNANGLAIPYLCILVAFLTVDWCLSKLL